MGLAGLAGLLAGRAEAAPPRVGVVVSLAVNVGDDESQALAVALGDALREKLVVDVVAGDQVARRMPPDGVPEDCVVKPECIRDLGSRLEADQLLLLVVARIGTRVQIDSTWADVASGRSVSREAVQIEDGGAPAAEVFREAALKLLPEATVRGAGEVELPGGGGLMGPEVGVIEQPGGGHRITTPVLVAGGVGVAALGGGVVFAILARSKYHDLKALCGEDMTCTDEQVAPLERRALIADILFAAALAAGAAATYFYFTSEAEPPAVDVQATPDSVSLLWGGRF